MQSATTSSTAVCKDEFICFWLIHCNLLCSNRLLCYARVSSVNRSLPHAWVDLRPKLSRAPCLRRMGGIKKGVPNILGGLQRQSIWWNNASSFSQEFEKQICLHFMLLFGFTVCSCLQQCVGGKVCRLVPSARLMCACMQLRLGEGSLGNHIHWNAFFRTPPYVHSNRIIMAVRGTEWLLWYGHLTLWPVSGWSPPMSTPTSWQALCAPWRQWCRGGYQGSIIKWEVIFGCESIQ